MFKNFFLTAPRNIVRNKIQSAIQVTSLTIGITAAILIGLYAKYEFSYNQFNEYTITGIIEDVKNSHLEINFLASVSSYDSLLGITRGDPRYLNNWIGNHFSTYLLLPEHTDPFYIESRINESFSINREDNSLDITEARRYSLRPLKDVYFTNGLRSERNYCRHGNRGLMYVLLTNAVFLLILAVINYVNLSTARASLRAREVGIRKLVGSSKLRLIQQFLTEAVLVSLFSFLLALTLVQLLIPEFNKFASSELELVINSGPGIWIMYLLAAILLGIISGIYPAFIMLRFKTISSLAGEQDTKSGSVTFRRALLTFQFTVSIVLIIGVLMVIKQLKYMKSADLGFNKEFVIYTEISEFGDPDQKSSRQRLKQELLKNPGIRGVTFSSNFFGTHESSVMFQAENNGIKNPFTLVKSDPDFFDVMQIDLIEGRNFSVDRVSDFTKWGDDNHIKIILNETAVKEYELESPIGYQETLDNGLSFEIIGVVKDINSTSQHEEIEPCIFVWGWYIGQVFIKIGPENMPSTLRYIKKEFESLFPYKVFDYDFLDETYNQQYHRDEQTAKIIIVFALIAILIACLGLFGLASFMAAKKTKEIGIRKALGASERSVFLLMSKELIRWVLMSVIIACPTGWYIMNRWLQTYAYRTNVGIGVLILAVITVFAIIFLTVSWHSLRTARTNPVVALRYE